MPSSYEQLYKCFTISSACVRLRAQCSRGHALINSIITKSFKYQWLGKMFISTVRCLVSWFLIIYSASYCGHDFMSGIWNILVNRPISQIPKCTCFISLSFSKSKIMNMDYLLWEHKVINLLWKRHTLLQTLHFILKPSFKYTIFIILTIFTNFSDYIYPSQKKS